MNRKHILKCVDWCCYVCRRRGRTKPAEKAEERSIVRRRLKRMLDKLEARAW